jgi:hypothetical protein
MGKSHMQSRGSVLWRFHRKLLCLGLSVSLLVSLAQAGAQEFVSVDRTVSTPMGRMGFWKVTAKELPGYTQSDYWILFGRLGKWHFKGSALRRPIPLMPVVLFAAITGVLVATARQRKLAATSRRTW